jgi:hypothetical protein
MYLYVEARSAVEATSSRVIFWGRARRSGARPMSHAHPGGGRGVRALTRRPCSRNKGWDGMGWMGHCPLTALPLPVGVLIPVGGAEPGARCSSPHHRLGQGTAGRGRWMVLRGRMGKWDAGWRESHDNDTTRCDDRPVTQAQKQARPGLMCVPVSKPAVSGEHHAHPCWVACPPPALQPGRHDRQWRRLELENKQ